MEAIERQRHADASCEREQVHDGVRAAADRHEHGDRVVECLGGQDLRWAQLLTRHPDGAGAGGFGRACPFGVDRRDRRGPGQAHPERLDERRHRRRCPHLVAMAVARGRGCFELVELRLRHPAGAKLVDVVPEVGARAELAAAEPRRLRRPSGELRGNGLVAAAEQDDRVERVRPNALLDVHRHQVPEEHRGRLHQVFAERDGRELEREPTGLEHAALHGFRERAEMKVAVDELGPRVADPDDGPAGERATRDSLGVQRRAVDEARQVVSAEPACAAQLAHVAQHPTRLERSLG